MLRLCENALFHLRRCHFKLDAPGPFHFVGAGEKNLFPQGYDTLHLNFRLSHDGVADTIRVGKTAYLGICEQSDS